MSAPPTNTSRIHTTRFQLLLAAQRTLFSDCSTPFVDMGKRALHAAKPIPNDLYTPSNTSSWVWQYFKLSVSEPEWAFCCVEHCSNSRRRVARSDGNTKNLSNHLKRHHSYITTPDEAAASTLRSITNRQAAKRRPCSEKTKKELDQRVLNFFIDNCMPFNAADSDSFVELLNFATAEDGHYVPPGRTALTAAVNTLYQQMIDTLLVDLKSNAVAITTDAATLANGHSFLAVTGHYITKAFELRDVTLLVQRMHGSHTGEYVSDLLECTVSAWQAEGRVFAAVTDNGSNFVRAVTINTQIPNSYRCACHTMQLALKDGIKLQPSLIQLTTDAQRLVKVIRRSGLLSEQLDAIQIQSLEAAAEVLVNADADAAGPHTGSTLTLILHVVTRFNSMCMLFTRLYELRSSVDRLCLTEGERMDGVRITSDQWAEMGELITILTPVKDVCDQLEHSKCPSMSLVIPLVAQLLEQLGTTVYNGLRLSSCKLVCAAVREAVYNRLKSAFDDHAAQCGMMLDPRVRSKKLPSWTDKRAANASLQVAFESFPVTHASFMGSNNPALRHQHSSAEADIADNSGEQREAKRHCVELVEENVEVRRVATEIDLFTAEAGIGVKDNPLEWWKARESRYPVLSQMARVYLCMPASSAPAERVFSAGTLVLTDKRRRLQDDRVAQLIFLKKNMSLYNKLKA